MTAIAVTLVVAAVLAVAAGRVVLFTSKRKIKKERVCYTRETRQNGTIVNGGEGGEKEEDILRSS